MEKRVEPFQCTIMRGGTSRAIFVKEKDISSFIANQEKLGQFILKVFGSPDPRQIDGLGGADLLTSKFSIISEPTIEQADIDYTFVQVGIAESSLNFSINCGNISSAVGVYAIEEGLVKAVEPITTVRIHNTNTKKILIAKVPVKNGLPEVYGTYSIDGVPGTGAKIDMDYAQTVGSKTGKLLPTGNVLDVLYVPELRKQINVSIVDIANLCVFFDLNEVGFDGTESLEQFDMVVMQKYRFIRKAVQERIGLSTDSFVPFTIGIQKPTNYFAVNGTEINEKDIDIIGRQVGSTSFKPHKAFPGTGSICLTVASQIPGTLPYEFSKSEQSRNNTLRIGHPSGVMNVYANVIETEGHIQVEEAVFPRTARRIMDGTVYIKW